MGMSATTKYGQGAHEHTWSGKNAIVSQMVLILKITRIIRDLRSDVRPEIKVGTFMYQYARHELSDMKKLGKSQIFDRENGDKLKMTFLNPTAHGNVSFNESSPILNKHDSWKEELKLRLL